MLRPRPACDATALSCTAVPACGAAVVRSMCACTSGATAATAAAASSMPAPHKAVLQ